MHETELNRERAFCQRNASLPDCVSCFLRGYEGVQSDGKGIAPRNPAASGTPGQDDVPRGCRLRPLSAWQFASLGRWEGIRVSAEFPAPREAPLLPATSKSKVSSAQERGLYVTKPAAEQLAAWGWHGSSCVLEQHLHPLG